MRCPKCHKKVHSDDIYCVFCSASLRGKSPDDPWNCICADEQIHRQHTAQSQRNRRSSLYRPKLLFLILAMVGILLAATAFVFYVGISLSSYIPEPQPEPVAPEDAWKLGTVIAQWEGFTITAEYLSIDELTGELQLIYTAENQTEHTIITTDSTITAEGYDLTHLLYIELEPGEAEKDYLWIDTAALQAVDVAHLQELTFSLTLTEAEHYTPLALTDPVTLDLDYQLPRVRMHRGDTTLIETEDLAVTLVGWQADPDYGEMIMYTLIENHSQENGIVFLEDACCGETDLHLYGYYDVPPGTKLLCWDILYDIPYSETAPTELSFRSSIQDAQFNTTATGKTIICLDPGGLSSEIRSEWE